MIIKNKPSKLTPKLLFGVAVIGFIILWLGFGGRRHYYHNTSLDYDSISTYVLAIGFALILPFLIYLFTTKSKQKKVLKSNPIDLNKMGLTTLEYFDKKEREKFVEIYVKNETSVTLIINREALLEPGSWYIFDSDKYNPIYFSNGIEFHITEELDLDIVDHRNQIVELKDDHFQKNDLPEYVNWAFVIAEPHKGDKIE